MHRYNDRRSGQFQRLPHQYGRDLHADRYGFRRHLERQQRLFRRRDGAPSQLVFTTEPANATGGTAFGTQPVVTIEDAGGNTVLSDTHAVALTIHSGPGGLSGCTETTTAGVAGFSGCTLNTAGTYTLTATDSGDTLRASGSSFDVGTGAPSRLVFTTPPANASGGTAFGTQPIVTIEDAGGNTVTTDTNAISLSLDSGAGSLSGCDSTTTSGVAAFSGCSVNTAGLHTLSAADTSDGLNSTSGSFAVTVGSASQLVFTTQPSSTATGGTAFGTQPAVTVEDAGGNAVISDSSTVTLAASGGSGTLANCTQSESAGVITFGNCSISTDGTYTLDAIDGSLTGANSDPITVSTGAASQLVFTTEPGDAVAGSAFGTQPVVTIEDAGGNTVTTDSNAITLSIQQGSGGTLSSCTSTMTAGVASFSGCAINDPGSYTLGADDATEAVAGLSSSFEVGPG